MDFARPGLTQFAARVVLGFFVATSAVRAETTGWTTLSNSVRPVAPQPAAGAAQPKSAFVSRSTLTAAETNAPMHFNVALKMRNFAEFQARIARGEHVPLAEVAAKYEPLPGDYAKVAAWLASQGLTISHQDPHHVAIFTTGTVAQVRKAMRVSFARVSSDGQEFTSAITAPSLPSTLSPLLIGVNGLQPHLRAHKHFMKPLRAQPQDGNGAFPYSPGQIAKAYHADTLYNAGITGAGQTIAIVIDTFPAASDLVQFWDSYGINQSMSNIQFIQAVPGTLAEPTGEETLDVEWSSAMAPGARIRVYATTDLANDDLDQGYERVYEDVTNHPSLGIHQMSMSYGEGESYAGSTQLETDDTFFAELANAGVSIFASSGDNGPTPLLTRSGETENGILQPESPASDPNVTGVGGTTLTLDSGNNESTETVWNKAATANFDAGASGGGTSTYFARPVWQTGPGVNPSAARQVPDISCAADPNLGADLFFEGGEGPTGGTSWASPTCAAFFALVNQARANVGLAPLGLLGPSIYPLNLTANFRDITSGNSVTANSGGLYRADLTPGYDECTGLGSPLVQTLAQTLTGTSTLRTVTQTPPIKTVNQGQSATITVTASGSPTGYQWQRMPAGLTTWNNIGNGGAYSGATTATLTVANTTAVMSGDQFQCLVTYGGPITLASAQSTVLIVEAPLVISTIAGSPGASGLANATGSAARFFYPAGIVRDSHGNFYVADLDNNAIRMVTPAGVVTTPYGSLSGTAGSTNGTGNAALFSAPRDLAIDSTDHLYVSDQGNALIRKIDTTTGAVTSIGTSASPAFFGPKGLAVDSSGNVYVADSGNNVIREIATSGAVTIFAGSASFAAGYQNGTGTGALFNEPVGLAIDSSNNLYVTDYNNEAIRKITPGQTVTTLAGQPGIAGCLDGTGTNALFNTPRAVVLDGTGNLYVTDSYAPVATSATPTPSGNNLLRKVTAAGVVSTLAGQGGIAGSSDGLGSAAQFYNPVGITRDASGNFYLTDASNDTIHMASPEPVISLVASQPNALAQGAIPGQFKVTRTGATTASLAVTYSVTGTAVSGTDFTALSGTVTIPAGAGFATIAVHPLTDTRATANLTVQATLTGPVSGVVLDPTPATVTIAEIAAGSLETYGSWANSFPGFTGTASATSLNDTIPNLEKFLTDIDPTQSMTGADRAALPASGVDTTSTVGTAYLTLTYRRDPLASDLTVNVQTSTDMQTWTTANPPDLLREIGTDPATGDPIIETGVILDGTGHQFIRLQITQP